MMLIFLITTPAYSLVLKDMHWFYAGYWDIKKIIYNKKIIRPEEKVTFKFLNYSKEKSVKGFAIFRTKIPKYIGYCKIEGNKIIVKTPKASCKFYNNKYTVKKCDFDSRKMILTWHEGNDDIELHLKLFYQPPWNRN